MLTEYKDNFEHNATRKYETCFNKYIYIIVFTHTIVVTGRKDIAKLCLKYVQRIIITRQ